jgi:hypothetical protein
MELFSHSTCPPNAGSEKFTTGVLAFHSAGTGVNAAKSGAAQRDDNAQRQQESSHALGEKGRRKMGGGRAQKPRQRHTPSGEKNTHTLFLPPACAASNNAAQHARCAGPAGVHSPATSVSDRTTASVAAVGNHLSSSCTPTYCANHRQAATSSGPARVSVSSTSYLMGFG